MGYDTREELEADVGTRAERDFEDFDEEPAPEWCGCTEFKAAPECNARNLWHKERPRRGDSQRALADFKRKLALHGGRR